MTVLVIFEIFILALSAVALLYAAYQLAATFMAAPYVKSNREAIKRMIESAELKAGMPVLELGSGDGEICLQAAERGAKAVGIEINPVLVLWARFRARRRGLSDRVTFIRGDFWKAQFPRETRVVFLYLLPRALPRLWSKMAKELEPGALVISHSFLIQGREPVRKNENVLVYKL